MKIAVVIPVRNGRAMVSACVAACWAQTRPPDELVVVDNGSTDDTADLAATAGATVVSEPSRGSYRARNGGWRSTSSDVVAFTDVDCLPAPDWLERLTEPFDDPRVAGVGGSIVQDEVHSATQRWMLTRHFLDQASNASHPFMPFFATANVAYRRSALEALGGFDDAFLSGGDNDFSWRLQALTGGLLFYRPEAEIRHRVGESLEEITSRCRRYAAGDILLERRWSSWPGFPPVPNRTARLKRVWQLPLAVAHRVMTRRALSVPFIDAAVALNVEAGRLRGRIDTRGTGLAPLHTVSGVSQLAQ